MTTTTLKTPQMRVSQSLTPRSTLFSITSHVLPRLPNNPPAPTATAALPVPAVVPPSPFPTRRAVIYHRGSHELLSSSACAAEPRVAPNAPGSGVTGSLSFQRYFMKNLSMLSTLSVVKRPFAGCWADLRINQLHFKRGKMLLSYAEEINTDIFYN